MHPMVQPRRFEHSHIGGERDPRASAVSRPTLLAYPGSPVPVPHSIALRNSRSNAGLSHEP
jgi:hypothetical protein